MDICQALRTTARSALDQDGIAVLGGAGVAFGGHMAAQALMAARHVEPDRQPHAMHAIFLAPAKADHLLNHRVERLKVGRAFSTIRVETWQDEVRCLNSTISFHEDEAAPEHQLTMPPCAGPGECAATDYIPPNTNPDVRRAFEIRLVDETATLAGGEHPQQTYWLRARQDLGRDPAVHCAALVWFSDLSMPWTTDLPYTEADGLWAGASLDHNVWFHRPFRADEWLLFVQESIVYAGARALTRGLFFTEAGALVATAAQETLVRRIAPDRLPLTATPSVETGS